MGKFIPKKVFKTRCFEKSGQAHIDYLVLEKFLTEKEVICLKLAAEGLSSVKSAEILGLKPSTVITHRKKAIAKLQAKSLAQAIYKSVKYNIIT